MQGRTRVVALLPWLLGGCALVLLVLSAVLRIALGGGPGTTGEDILTAVAEPLGFLGYPLVGAVIAARLPDNPYGWLWCALGISYGLLALSAALAEGGAANGWPVSELGYLGYLGLAGLLVFVFLLFPTGRLPSPGWRWLAWATVALGVLLAVTAPFTASLLDTDSTGPWAPGGTAGRWATVLVTAGSVGLLLLTPVAMVSLVPRYRRAGAVERRQLKWFVLAAAVNAVYLVADAVVDAGRSVPWTVAQVGAASLIPAAVGVAVLRYRLYEIDRIISRTVSYGLLTGALVGLYLVLVALLRPLLEPVTGSSSLAVAGSTLAVAAVFNPARRRLQAAVDRRFDRARYDASRAVDAFAASLRNQVDLDQVTAGLQETVADTVAPTRVAVWLRAPARSVG